MINYKWGSLNQAGSGVVSDNSGSRKWESASRFSPSARRVELERIEHDVARNKAAEMIRAELVNLRAGDRHCPGIENYLSLWDQGMLHVDDRTEGSDGFSITSETLKVLKEARALLHEI